jgi:D-alanyl-D-alanine carboxypeptidase
LIAHEDLAAEVVAIFEQLLQLRYPIEKIRTVDTYPAADDELSMEDNNTSAFNCRDIPGTGRWSQHAFGRAIDLNPLLNPYIDRTATSNPRTPHHTAHTFKSNPSFRTNLRGYGERSSTGAAAAPASAEPFTSGQPIGAESKTC